MLALDLMGEVSMRKIIFFTMLFCLFSARAQEWSPAQVFVASDSVRPGARLPVAVKLSLSEGWHTYALEPGDFGMAPSFRWSGVDGLKQFDWQFAPAKTFQSDLGTSYGYDGSVVFLSEIELPDTLQIGQRIELTAALSWMICSDRCVLQRDSKAVVLTVAPSSSPPTSEWDELIRTSAWGRLKKGPGAGLPQKGVL